MALALAAHARVERTIWFGLAIALGAVILQALWLLPVLDARAEMIISGRDPAERAMAHALHRRRGPEAAQPSGHRLAGAVAAAMRLAPTHRVGSLNRRAHREKIALVHRFRAALSGTATAIGDRV
jgi:hypothetical protein